MNNDSIMVEAITNINVNRTDDLYIPVKMSEYRQLVHDCADLAVQLKAAEDERLTASSERWHLRSLCDKQEKEIAELKKKLDEVKEAAE